MRDIDEQLYRIIKHAHKVVVSDAIIRNNVYEFLKLRPNPITIKNDLPLNASRLFADATGIENVFCNGKEIVDNGDFTEERPGLVLRSGKHTRNPSMV